MAVDFTPTMDPEKVVEQASAYASWLYGQSIAAGIGERESLANTYAAIAPMLVPAALRELKVKQQMTIEQNIKLINLMEEILRRMNLGR